MAHAVTLATVTWVFKQSDLRRLQADVAHHLNSGVGGAIVDDDYFGMPAVGADAGHDFLQGRGNARGFVKGWNHDAVLRILRHDHALSPRSHGPHPGADSG